MAEKFRSSITPYKDASEVWPLFALLSLIPLHPIATYAAVSAILYVLFLIIAALTGVFGETAGSLMHLLQIFVSISVFAALSLGRYSANLFANALEKTNVHFQIEDVAYQNVYSYITTKSGSTWSLSLAAPFCILCIIVVNILGDPLPNLAFPVTRSSALFVYVAYLEISVLLVYLMGSVGLWCFVVIAIAFKKLESYRLRLSALGPDSNLYELPKAVLTAATLEFLVYTSISPFVFYLVIVQAQSKLLLWIGAFSLGSTYLTLIALVIACQFSIHKLLRNAKRRRLEEINHSFTRIQYRIEAYPNGFSAGKDGMNEVQGLVRLNTYLMEVYEKARKDIRVWLIDIPAIGKLFASSLVPIAAFASLVHALFQ